MSLAGRITLLATRIGNEINALRAVVAGKSNSGHDHDDDYLGKTATALQASKLTVSDHSTNNTEYPLVWHNNSNSLFDTVSKMTFNPLLGRISVTEIKEGGTTLSLKYAPIHTHEYRPDTWTPVVNTIRDLQTATSPSENAVYDALQLKAASNHGDHGLAIHAAKSDGHPRDTRCAEDDHDHAIGDITGLATALGDIIGGAEIDDTEPTAPQNGMFWFQPTSGILSLRVAGVWLEVNDLILPSDALSGSIKYENLDSTLTAIETATSTIDLSGAGGGEITLSSNTAFTFNSFEVNKTYLLTVNANGFIPSFAAPTKHLQVEGNATFSTTGTYYITLTCLDNTSGNEKLLTTIMKGV